MRSVRALVAIVLAIGIAGVGEGAASAAPRARRGTCTPRILVVSAFPAEIGKLLDAAQLDPKRTVDADGRRFYVGRLRGNDVILALTGIGPVNAKRTTDLAFARFRCGERSAISAVVFSGVAGGQWIGDVAVPTRWTEDAKNFLAVDGTMLATARRVAASGSVHLERQTPLGDPACACVDPDLVKTVNVNHVPAVVVGGDGITSDPVGGRAVPCVPSGGDVFGCEPCRDQHRAVPDVPRLASSVLPFVDPNFFLDEFRNPPIASDPKYAAQDEETATVARVAAGHDTPFIGFRGVSDGGGDPLMLPGFPFQFFVYRQLAADNAAAMTLGFLQAWARAPRSSRV